MKPLHVLSIAGLFVASACSSHGTDALPMSASTPAAGHTAGTAAALSIVVPSAKGSATASTVRRPQYVSPSSSQLQVAVNGGTASTYGLTPATPGCSVVSGNLTCTFSIAAPPGTDAFTLTLTDSSGSVLSKNIVNATLTAGASTPVDVTLAGIPASVRAVPAANAGIEGSATPSYHIPGLLPQNIELQALDADGNVIIGPGAPAIGAPTVSSGSAYATVASAHTTDPNAYIITPAVGAGGQTVSITASAQSIPLNDGSTSAPVSTSTNFTYTPAIAVASGFFVNIYSVETGKQVGQFKACPGNCGTVIANGIATDPSGNIYASYSLIGGISIGHGVTEFLAGTTTPSRVLGSANGVTGPGPIAVDQNGMLYVGNAASGFFPHRTAASIAEFAPGATTPKYKITGSSIVNLQGLAVDASGKVYLAQSSSITVYGPGNQTVALQTISDPSLGSPNAIAFDAASGMYVIDHANHDIAYFASGSTSVTNTLTYADFANIPNSLMFDPSGNLWVTVPNTGAIHQFAAGSLPGSLSLSQNLLVAAPYIAWVP
jgi:hypothetical protein